jgi:hypothetical protein
LPDHARPIGHVDRVDEPLVVHSVLHRRIWSGCWRRAVAPSGNTSSAHSPCNGAKAVGYSYLFRLMILGGRRSGERHARLFVDYGGAWRAEYMEAFNAGSVRPLTVGPSFSGRWHESPTRA